MSARAVPQFFDLTTLTPKLQPQPFTVLSADHIAQTFTVASNSAKLFPVGSACFVTNSSTADGYYTVATVTQTRGTTVVGTVETIPDLSAGGSLCNLGTAGLQVAPARGVYLTSGIFVSEAFGGADTALMIGPYDPTEGGGSGLAAAWTSIGTAGWQFDTDAGIGYGGSNALFGAVGALNISAAPLWVQLVGMTTGPGGGIGRPDAEQGKLRLACMVLA